MRAFRDYLFYFDHRHLWMLEIFGNDQVVIFMYFRDLWVYFGLWMWDIWLWMLFLIYWWTYFKLGCASSLLVWKLFIFLFVVYRERWKFNLKKNNIKLSWRTCVRCKKKKRYYNIYQCDLCVSEVAFPNTLAQRYSGFLTH